MILKIFYNPFINKILRNILKPFRNVLPSAAKFPINGLFTVKGKNVPEFLMFTNPTSAVTKYLFWGNVEGFEYNAVRIFKELVTQSNVFIDIGSNIGYYSLLASAITCKKIQVFAVEPMPSAYEFLKKNISINNFDNIKPFRVALSDEVGLATFYQIRNEKFSGMPQLTGDGSLNDAHSSNKNKFGFDVDIDTLDQFVTKNLGEQKVDLIKLDTEAHEHKVLAGAEVILKMHRPIIQCEILKNQIEYELQKILEPHNYLFYRATEKGLLHVKMLNENESNFLDYYLIPFEKLDYMSRFFVN